MRKSAMLLVCGLFFFLNISQAQEVIIGKENIDAPDLPIRTLSGFNYQYNQFIYKQKWIHSKGSINKIAYYYKGTSTESFDIVVFMGHTTKNEFAYHSWLPYSYFTKVYEGQFTLPGHDGWVEISLQNPFEYNNTDNLVIAIDKNSIDDNPTGGFSNSVIDDDLASLMSRDDSYNIDPSQPQGENYPVKEIPNIKISGNLTESPYLYIYGPANRDISTDPNSAVIIDVESNLFDYNIDNDQTWVTLSKNIAEGSITAKVVSLNSTLKENKRTANIILSGQSVQNDTVSINQYMFEPVIINSITGSFIDYNNDNKLDLVGSATDVALNNGNGSFILTNLNIQYGRNGLSFWCDYDKDNDADFLLIGWDNLMNRITKIFRNDGNNIFIDIHAGLKVFQEMEIGVWSYATWRDYNNDGKPDLLITGRDIDNTANTILYRNEGNDVFTESTVELTKCSVGSADWADYNNDGLFDLALVGEDINGNAIAHIYRNEGSELFSKVKVNLLGLKQGNISWGDYDNDNDPDLLISGTLNFKYYLYIYRNDGNDKFTSVTSMQNGVPSWAGWADYDNDSDLDIISYFPTLESAGAYLIRYKNTGDDQFSMDYTQTIPDYWQEARFSIGDYDNDGDLDLLFLHTYDNYCKIYRNNSNINNTPPSVPSGLNTIRKGTRTYFQWNAASDEETNSSLLTYNVRVGTAPGKGDIVLPMSDLSTGFIRLPGPGSSSADTTFMLDNLPLGTYYWSVQSVDNMYSGSQFAQEKSFTVLPPFTEINAGIAQLRYSSAAWGDYDNDNDMDLVVSGRLTKFDGETLRIYKNNGDSTFSEKILNIQGRYSGSIVWGDYDNDNDLDILLTGKNIEGQDNGKIIRNDGNDQFSELAISLTSSQNSSGIWCDIDNDGDLDLAVNSNIYRNDKNDKFTPASSPPQWTDMTNNSFADFDYDNDKDFFLTGQWLPLSVFENTDSIFTPEITKYSQVYLGSMDWADYNSDGKLDLLISGRDTSNNNWTLIYKNNGPGGFEEIETEIRGVSQGDALWGDFDNDGDPDIVVEGWSGKKILKVYVNKGNDSFQEIFDFPINEDINLGYMDYSNWGDYNNDGNLDVLKNGLIFSNNYNTPNIPPLSPDSLKVTINGFDAVFSWADPKNPVGVTYNLRIGTTPGGYEIVSPMSDIKTGYRKIPAIGNVQNNTSWIIKGLKPAVTYYWSIQAVDAALKGGSWTPEQSFIMGDIYPDFRADTVCYGSSTSFTDLSVSPLGPVISWKWDFGDGDNATTQNPEHEYKNPGEYSVTLAVKKDTLTFRRTKKILVKPSPVADFIYENTPQNRTIINFTNKSDTGTLNISKWAWDFGDALKFDGRDPQPHGYSENGLKKVTLAVKAENGCSDTAKAEIMICNEPLDKPQILSFGPNVWYMTCSNTTARLYRWYIDNKVITGANTYFYLANQKTGIYKVEISNEGNCYVPSDEIEIPKGITGIEDSDPFEGVKIYPNPTPGMFTIEMDNNIFGELVIDIYNQTGSKALNIKFEKTTEHSRHRLIFRVRVRGCI